MSKATASFTADDVGIIFTWDQVSDIHKVRNGICQRHGVLISLLTGFGRINRCYWVQDRN